MSSQEHISNDLETQEREPGTGAQDEPHAGNVILTSNIKTAGNSNGHHGRRRSSRKVAHRDLISRLQEARVHYRQNTGPSDHVNFSLPDTVDFLLDKARQSLRQVDLPIDQVKKRVNLAEAEAAKHVFMKMSGALNESGVVLERMMTCRQWLNSVYGENPDAKTAMLSALVKENKLEIVPKMHWRVDRSIEECSQRWGFDYLKYKEAFPDDDGDIKFESGVGNGTSLAERQNLFEGTEFGMGNSIPYPLAPLIGALVSRERVEKAIGMKLAADEWLTLCHFLYAILVIAPGQTSQEVFDYDMEVRDAINADPNAILRLLPEKIRDLPSIPSVPQVISKHVNGKTIYPHKLYAPTTPAFKAACALLAKQAPEFFTETKDVLHMIPVNPVGAFLGEFAQVKNLAPRQIHEFPDARGLVYYRGMDYMTLVFDILEKLVSQGLFWSDSIRDNDGWRYRLAEWMAIQAIERVTDPAMHMPIIVGPSFDGEDEYQGPLGVPKCVIATRSPAKLAFFRDERNLLPPDKRTGAPHRLLTLDEICNDKAYLALLSSDGLMTKEVDHAEKLLDGTLE